MIHNCSSRYSHDQYLVHFTCHQSSARFSLIKIAFIIQVAASTLMAICQRIGPDLTALHVLPRLKELFDELAFSQETPSGSGSLGRSWKIPKPKADGEAQIESRMDLVWVLVKVHAICLEANLA